MAHPSVVILPFHFESSTSLPEVKPTPPIDFDDTRDDQPLLKSSSVEEALNDSIVEEFKPTRKMFRLPSRRKQQLTKPKRDRGKEKVSPGKISQLAKAKRRAYNFVQVPTTGWDFKRAQGLGLIVFAGFNFSIASICIKYASHQVTSYETVFWRMSVALVLNLILMRYKKQMLLLKPGHRRLMLLRCVVGTIGLNLQFYAMAKMVLADAVVIIKTTPIFTFFLGAVVLKESIGRFEFMIGITSLIGVMLVARPAFLFPSSTDSAQPPVVAVLCAIGGSMTSAVVYILQRRLKDVNPLVAIHYFFLFGTCASVLTLVVLGVPLRVPVDAKMLFSVLGCGFFSFIGQVFMAMGIQREKAGVASVMRYFDVVFVVVMDVLVLGETMNVWSLVGAAIIMVGVSMIVLRRTHE